MKNPAQNRYPYDATVLGLDGTYQVLDNNSFLVKSDCIASTGNIITVGKEYILFYSPKETGFKILDVVLVDCYYYEGLIHLIVRDIRSQRVFTIDHCLECPENDCTWVLVDLDYFIDRMDTKAIRQYCGNCDDTKKKPSDENKHQNIHDDDLLEFEF